MACTNCYHCRELDELKEGLRNAGGARDDQWRLCATPQCGHYKGEHDAEGCHCIVIKATSEYECTCASFTAVDASEHR